MYDLVQRKIARILFDEYHSESWSVSEVKAKEVQPKDFQNSSYHKAASTLSKRDFIIERNMDSPLSKSILKKTDILAILHPCDSKWEQTTSANSPKFSKNEIRNIINFVNEGGSLLVITEYENDKYGSNLNDLLLAFDIQIENSTVSDVSDHTNNHPNWVFADLAEGAQETPLFYKIKEACFYRSASCLVFNNAINAIKASENATPQAAGLIAISKYGEGRIAVVGDSDIFGDEYFEKFDHAQLWLNIIYWLSVPAFAKSKNQLEKSPAANSKQWITLKSLVDTLRTFQTSNDGSVDLKSISINSVKTCVNKIVSTLQKLKVFFPHQDDYIENLSKDFLAWSNSDFIKPDFSRSLAVFTPHLTRRDNIEHLVVFPMYMQNASNEIRFEALLIRVPWPNWLSELESKKYNNDKFVTACLVDFTEGYDSECATLFPETVSVKGSAPETFGVIFCDREAKRYQTHTLKSLKILQVTNHPELECFLSSLDLIQEAFSLWDLLHDRSHAKGFLPRDPYLVRQKLPFWIYALEELRVELYSFHDAFELAKHFPFANYVIYAILFDRIFRFPVTGERVKNYDSLAGQLLFAFLNKGDIVKYQDNKLIIEWSLLEDAVTELRNELAALYRKGINFAKVPYWMAAHDLISRFVEPNVASKWKKRNRRIHDESDPKNLVESVHPDEFPLGQFYINLQRKLKQEARTNP